MSVRKFLTSSVSVERRTGSDPYSGDTFAAPVSVAARWFDEARVVRGFDAREVLSNAHVSVVEPIGVGDRVTAPDGRAREVVMVRRNETTRGVFSHFVAYLA